MTTAPPRRNRGGAGGKLLPWGKAEEGIHVPRHNRAPDTALGRAGRDAASQSGAPAETVRPSGQAIWSLGNAAANPRQSPASPDPQRQRQAPAMVRL